MTGQELINRPSRPIIAYLLSGISVIVCYFFVDRPVAWFVRTHRFYPDYLLLWPPLISEWLYYAVIPGIIGVVAWRLWRPGGQLQTLPLGHCSQRGRNCSDQDFAEICVWPHLARDVDQQQFLPDRRWCVRFPSLSFRRLVPVISLGACRQYICCYLCFVAGLPTVAMVVRR